jgi:hypothetical protein
LLKNFIINFQTIKKFDLSEAVASRVYRLEKYGKVTHGVQEIFDETGLMITHANYNRKFRVIYANRTESRAGVSQDQILDEMAKILGSVPTFIAKTVEKYYQ